MLPRMRLLRQGSLQVPAWCDSRRLHETIARWLRNVVAANSEAKVLSFNRRQWQTLTSSPEHSPVHNVSARDKTRVVGNAATSLHRSLALVFLMIPTSSLTGCVADAFNVSQQTAVVLVTRANSQEPIRAAQVDAEGRYYKGWMSQLDESARNDLWFSRGMNDPATTNDEGRATLPINIGMIRGGLFPEHYDPHQDRLTGQVYLFRIQEDRTTETLDVAMVPHHRSHGRLFEIAVESIGPSKDVTQEYVRRGHMTPPPEAQPAPR